VVSAHCEGEGKAALREDGKAAGKPLKGALQMNDNYKKSIMEMARGGFLERVDYEMSGIMGNILDPNTKATAKRKLTITMELTPDDDRTTVSVKFTSKSALAPTNPVMTSLYITENSTTGEVCAVEMVPQMPGQFSLDGEEQERPAQLKLIKLA